MTKWANPTLYPDGGSDGSFYSSQEVRGAVPSLLSRLLVGGAIFVMPLRPEGRSGTEYLDFVPMLAEPLNQISKYGLYAALLFFAFVAIKFFLLERRVLQPPGYVFYIFAAVNIYIFARMVVYDAADLPRFVTAILLILVTFVLYSHPFPAESFRYYFRTAGQLLLIGTLWQYVRDPSIIMWNNRWMGIVNHPVFLALFSAIYGIIAFSFALESERTGKRVWAFVEFCAFSLLIVLSGSRTGLLTMGCGVGAMVFAHGNKTRNHSLGFLFLFSALLAGMVLVSTDLGSSLFDEDNRVLSTQDTRSKAWATQLATFEENPLFGSGYTDRSESSFLAALSIAGLVGGLGYLLFFFSGLSRAIAVIFNFGGRYDHGSIGFLTCASLLLALLAASLVEGFAIMGIQVVSTGIIALTHSIYVLERETIDLNSLSRDV